MLIQELKKNDNFIDSEVSSISKLDNGQVGDLVFNIIGQHVYTITNNIDTIIVVEDLGNSNGKVIETISYNVKS